MQSKNFFDQFETKPSGVVITKPTTPKSLAETTIAEAQARNAPTIQAADARIKNAQAAEIERKNADAAAEDAAARIRPTGKLRLDQLPDSARPIVSAMLAGNLPVGARSVTSPQMLPYLQMAINVDPNFSAATFPARAAATKQLADMKSTGGYLTSLAANIDHSKEEEAAIQRLNNPGGVVGRWGGAALHNWLINEGGPAGAQFNQANRVYSGEQVKSIVGNVGSAGGGSALADRQDAERAISASMPIDAQRAALRTGAMQNYQKFRDADQGFMRTMGTHIPNALSQEQAAQLLHLMRLREDGTEGPIPNDVDPGFVALATGAVTPPPGSGNSNPPPGSRRPGGGPFDPDNPFPTKRITGIQDGPSALFNAFLDKQAGLTGGKYSVGNDDQLYYTLPGGKPTWVDLPDSIANSQEYVDWFKRKTGRDSLLQVSVTGGDQTPQQRVANADRSTTVGGIDAPVREFSNAASLGLATPLEALLKTPFNGKTFGENLQAGRALDEADYNIHPYTSIAGTLIGGAAGAGGLEAGLTKAGQRFLPGAGRALERWVPRVADATFGGVSGYTGADGSGGNSALGAGMGVGGGIIGRAATRGLGNLFTGVQNESVRTLADRGVPMTIAQILSQSGTPGRVIKGVEDAATSIPVVGDVINARRLEGIRGFNQAAFDEGLAPVTQQNIGQIGENGVAAGRDLFRGQNGAYSRALDGVTLTPDQPFTNSVAAALVQGTSLPRVGAEFGSFVNHSVAPHFSAANGQIHGQQVQDILQQIRGFDAGTDSMGNLASGYARDIEGAVMDLADRQAPGAMDALGDANTGYRNLNILADAVGRGANNEGMFMPSQLGMAAKANATRFGGKISAATPDRPFYDLQRAGQNVLPSKLADSGTGKRVTVAALLAASGGGAGYGASDDKLQGTAGGIGSTLALGALLTAGGSRTSQRIIAHLLIQRPDIAVRIGRQIQDSAAIPGMFGAGAGTAVLPYLTGN